MIQTILIVLVAVVVLIVIIAVLALRYLRADDSGTFDDIPDEPRPVRRPVPQDRGRPGPPARRLRQSEQVTEVWAADRTARTPDTRAPSGTRDRAPGPRQTGPQRAASQPPARREVAGSRPVRAAARPDGPDAATASWDSLSDVDYWAELAANRPDITPAASGPLPAVRHGSEPVSDIRPAAGRQGGRGDSGHHLPMRKRHQPSRPSQQAAASARTTDAGQTEQFDARAAQAAAARYNGDAPASSPDVLGRHGQPRPAAQQPRSSEAQRPTGSRHTQPAPTAQPAYQSRPPAPATPPPPNGRSHSRADDDPLTSPSFPAVNTSDSRSYRARRSRGASQADANGQPTTNGQHGRPAAEPGTTSHQYIEYSSAPRRSASQSNGYPAGTPAQAAAERQSPAAPAANPYGSYVSQPGPAYSETARPQPGRASAGYPEPPAPSLAAAAYGGHSAGQQAGSASWYTAPAMASGSQQAAAQPLGPANGYLPAAGLGGNGRGGGSHALNGSQNGGPAGIDYSSIRYDDPAYPDAAGALPGYRSAGQHAAPYDQQGYGSQDPAAGQDRYGGYPGYGTGGR